MGRASTSLKDLEKMILVELIIKRLLRITSKYMNDPLDFLLRVLNEQDCDLVNEVSNFKLDFIVAFVHSWTAAVLICFRLF